MRAAEVVLTSEQQATLQSWLAAGKTEQRLAFRAQIILALAEGLSNKATAGRLATRPATVSKWRGRFARQGLAGVADAPRSGKPRHYQTNDERRIIAALDASPPAGYARWNGTLLAKYLGDISKHQIWRVLREHEISLERRRSWASAPIRRSRRRPPTSWRSICSRRRTAWSCRSTKSRTSRLWSVPRAG